MFRSIELNGLAILALVTYCLGQNYGGGQIQYNQPQQQQQQQYNPQQYHYNTPAPPQILTHKQALNHDGNFKYVFTAENGLAQGETIAPDGSRNGGYTYVDPNGKKISIKYTAGKEGFRILEGDHLPKAPLPIVPVPVPQQQPSYVPQAYNAGNRYDDGQYRPELYEKPRYQPAPYQQQASYPVPQIQSNTIEDKQDYHDEPGKPHSFGNGYVFEFSG